MVGCFPIIVTIIVTERLSQCDFKNIYRRQVIAFEPILGIKQETGSKPMKAYKNSPFYFSSVRALMSLLLQQ